MDARAHDAVQVEARSGADGEAREQVDAGARRGHRHRLRYERRRRDHHADVAKGGLGRRGRAAVRKDGLDTALCGKRRRDLGQVGEPGVVDVDGNEAQTREARGGRPDDVHEPHGARSADDRDGVARTELAVGRQAVVAISSGRARGPGPAQPVVVDPADVERDGPPDGGTAQVDVEDAAGPEQIAQRLDPVRVRARVDDVVEAAPSATAGSAVRSRRPRSRSRRGARPPAARPARRPSAPALRHHEQPAAGERACAARGPRTTLDAGPRLQQGDGGPRRDLV